MEGRIKRIVRDRGFGFIRVQGHEVFFHRSGLDRLEFESLKEGQIVEFKLERSERGLQATKVRIAGDNSGEPSHASSSTLPATLEEANRSAS